MNKSMEADIIMDILGLIGTFLLNISRKSELLILDRADHGWKDFLPCSLEFSIYSVVNLEVLGACEFKNQRSFRIVN